MAMVLVCAQCNGKGWIDRGCADPQCGDSTWDHNCTLGSKACTECRCPSCGISGLRGTLVATPVTWGTGEAAVTFTLTVPSYACPACEFEFHDADASTATDSVVEALNTVAARIGMGIDEAITRLMRMRDG